MKMNEQSNIVLPNGAFAWGTKYHLTTDEFLLYVHLQFMKQIGQWNQTITSIDMLIQNLGLQTKNKQRDKAEVITNLRSLEKKAYIKIDCDGDIKKAFFTVMQVQELLSPKFIVEIDEGGKKRTFKGFTKLSGELYNLANNEGRALMVIACIEWRKKINYDVPKSEWVKILGIAKSTLEASFKDYEKRFLHIVKGDYYQNEQGEIRQETNSYTVMDQDKASTKLEETVEKYKVENDLDKMRERVTDSFIKNDNKIFMQIFDKKTYIEFEGYIAWKKTNCEYVKREGQKKIDKMLASQVKDGYVGRVVERLETEYQEYIELRKKQHDTLELMSQKHLEELESMDEDTSVTDETLEFVTPYIKKDKSDEDFTSFLDDY